MTEKDRTKLALNYILESGELFTKIKAEIDKFIAKYKASWLPLSQVSTIQEILLSENRETVMERLHQYGTLQLRRPSEKDKWQMEADGIKAIDYFVDMVKGLAERHSNFIRKKLEDDCRLIIDDEYQDEIFKTLLSSFTHIFVTTMRSKQEAKDV